jgi:5-methyltetrahydrofolate--homocysteine methyltransferase
MKQEKRQQGNGSAGGSDLCHREVRVKNDIRKKLGKEWLFCDGGFGTLLQESGLKGGELPESWNITRPGDVAAIHSAYIEAGSNIICTNTFGANVLKHPDDLKEVVEAGVALAMEARDEHDNRSDSVYVALDIGPTGRLLAPMGDLPFGKAVDIFGEVARIGEEAGADLIFIETMSDSYEAKAAVLGAKENTSLPVFVTVTFDSKGKLLTGGTVESVTAMLEGLGVDAIGVNCGLGPEQMIPIVRKFAACASVPVIVDPNAGLPRTENMTTVYDIDADGFSDTMADIARMGVQVIGGCCGTTPEHIRKTIDKVSKLPFIPNTAKQATVVSSFSRAVEIGTRPAIIGERINPTGKKKFKEALRNNDIEYILNEGLNQEAAGADILDVNVGLPEIDESAMMETVIGQLQSITALPLQIDTSDINALERGMRLYNGKPMINSVNGKKESIEAVMPLVAKYGGVLVALPLDEDGIPDTAAGRIAVAKKIYEAAEHYGIPRKDIVIDGLAMTISADSHSAVTTLNTIRSIRDELHGHSVLGVSNISFGLPQRQLINSYFLTMAMQNGLSAAIINPVNETMMAAYRSFLALMDMDPNCGGFIKAYGLTAEVNIAGAVNKGAAQSGGSMGGSSDAASGSAGGSSVHMTPGEAIERGLTEAAREATVAELGSSEPMELINKELIPALDRVGRGFEAGTIYLPQLLMSAEAAKACFAVVKDSMKSTESAVKGRIIVATVKGDIHDIGKNIVKVMLENYGYDVMDLGKDVAPETIVDAAIDGNVRLVGLSALMTTTVVSMEQTIKLLRQKKPDTKVVVGGAVMTAECAGQIGADAYAKDAMATVRYADSVFVTN